MQQYFLVTGRQLEPLPPKPVLSDFYVPSEDHYNRELTFIMLSMIGITLYNVCLVHRWMFSTSGGGVQYIGGEGGSVHRRDTMSTLGGYHEYIGCTFRILGVGKPCP